MFFHELIQVIPHFFSWLNPILPTYARFLWQKSTWAGWAPIGLQWVPSEPQRCGCCSSPLGVDFHRPLCCSARAPKREKHQRLATRIVRNVVFFRAVKMASNHKHLNGDIWYIYIWYIYIYILIYDIWRYMRIFTCPHFMELAEVLPAQKNHVDLVSPSGPHGCGK